MEKITRDAASAAAAQSLSAARNNVRIQLVGRSQMGHLRFLPRDLRRTRHVPVATAGRRVKDARATPTQPALIRMPMITAPMEPSLVTPSSIGGDNKMN